MAHFLHIDAPFSLPADDDDKVHDVPQIPHVAVLVEDKAQRQDLGAHLDGEDDHEYGLQVFLPREKEMKGNYYVCLVVVVVGEGKKNCRSGLESPLGPPQPTNSRAL